MSGASYGGGIQFITAARDSRVDVIAPDIAWHSLVTALFKDRAVKSGWGTVLWGAGNASGLAPGLIGGQTGTLDPHIQSAYLSGVTTGDISDADRAWFDEHGPHHLLDRVRIPTFLIQGTADTLFTPQEAIDNYATLEKHGRPLKMMWFCGGHGICLTGEGEGGRLRRTVIAWFDRHLKRDSSVDTGAKFEWLADDAQWRTAGGYPLPPKAPLVGDGSGTLPLAPTNDSGQVQIAATPAANAVNVPIASPTAETQILGAPKLELTYSGTGASTGANDHVYAQVVNTRTGQVVGNQATPIPVELDGAQHSVERPLEPLASAATPASSYQLQLIASTGVYGPQRAAGAVTFSRVHVELPTVDERAAAVGAGGSGRGDTLARLKLGSLFRVAKSRRKVRVAVTARGTLTNVVVTIRSTRGRTLGRSKPVRVNRRRKVAVTLRRPIRAGRYVIAATGRTGQGDSVRVTRRDSLR